MRVRIRRFGQRQGTFRPLARVGSRSRELLSPLAESRRLHLLRSTSSIPIRESRLSMLVARTLCSGHVFRSALPDASKRPSVVRPRLTPVTSSPPRGGGCLVAEWQVSSGKPIDCRCTLARFTALPLDGVDFVVSCPLVRAHRLLSGLCSSSRSFAARFLQTSPRGDALALS